MLTAREDGFDNCPDDQVLARATALQRVLFTHNTDFIAITGAWLAAECPFPGVVYGALQVVAVGRAIQDLELICRVLSAEEMANQLLRLPL